MTVTLPEIIFSFMIIFIGFGIFIFILIKKKSLADIEKNQKPIYTDNSCGGCLGRFDTINLSQPSVRVSVYNDFIVISTYKKIILQVSDLLNVDVKYGFLSKGVNIYHKNVNYANPLAIWSSKPEKLRENINRVLEIYKFNNPLKMRSSDKK